MKYFPLIILIGINSNAQDCPIRIGDFEINTTKPPASASVPLVNTI
ncbi:hypothetical protein [Flavobacterium daemonense]|nr:hypothetical protein [Flavobacterium daemonense]KAF2335094.1 hypothetical protein FND99_07715 [Flavobacterium daemonense]